MIVNDFMDRKLKQVALLSQRGCAMRLYQLVVSFNSTKAESLIVYSYVDYRFIIECN